MTLDELVVSNASTFATLGLVVALALFIHGTYWIGIGVVFLVVFGSAMLPDAKGVNND